MVAPCGSLGPTRLLGGLVGGRTPRRVSGRCYGSLSVTNRCWMYTLRTHAPPAWQEAWGSRRRPWRQRRCHGQGSTRCGAWRSCWRAWRRGWRTLRSAWRAGRAARRGYGAAVSTPAAAEAVAAAPALATARRRRGAGMGAAGRPSSCCEGVGARFAVFLKTWVACTQAAARDTTQGRRPCCGAAGSNSRVRLIWGTPEPLPPPPSERGRCCHRYARGAAGRPPSAARLRARLCELVASVFVQGASAVARRAAPPTAAVAQRGGGHQLFAGARRHPGAPSPSFTSCVYSGAARAPPTNPFQSTFAVMPHTTPNAPTHLHTILGFPQHLILACVLIRLPACAPDAMLTSVELFGASIGWQHWPRAWVCSVCARGRRCRTLRAFHLDTESQ